MKKFIIRLSILALIMVAIDWCCGLVSAKLFDTVQETDTAKWRAITKEIDDEVLLMGSSRCTRHYDPSIISDTLATTVYNCGKEGMGIYFAYGELQILLNRYTPKVIVYELTPEYDLFKTNYDNSRFLKPLYGFYDLKPIKDLVNDLQPDDRYKMVSQLYRNNETMAQYFKGILKKQAEADGRGFKPLEGVVDTTVVAQQSAVIQAHEIDPVKVSYLERFIDCCEANDIRLIFTISPGSFDRAYCDAEAYDFFHTLANSRGIPLIDNLENPQLIGHPELFYDINHLNGAGADIYSEIVAKQLKELSSDI